MKSFIAVVSRVVLNGFLIVALIALASLVGVGGAALWIYGSGAAAQPTAKSASPRLKATVAANVERDLPQLTPMQDDTDAPAQLTPARYLPTGAEIATLSDKPRYTYVSYNGGRQQAHLKVTMVLPSSRQDGGSVPPPLMAASSEPTFGQPSDRPPLSDATSRYITDARGRVIGVDGTAGAVAEARAQRVSVARALPVNAPGVAPEVRVAAPVVENGQRVYTGGYTVPASTPSTTNYMPIRKALPVGSDEVSDEAALATGGFNVRRVLAQQDDNRPVLRAQPVAHSTPSNRPSMFGASDDLRGFSRY